MAPKTKAPAAPPPARETLPTPNQSTSNGVLTNNLQPPGGAAVNKKKQKRRQKEALRAASQHYPHDDLPSAMNPQLNGHPTHDPLPPMPPPAQYEDPNFAADDYGHDPADYAYSDEDAAYDYEQTYRATNGLDLGNGTSSAGRKKKKGKPAGVPQSQMMPYQQSQAQQQNQLLQQAMRTAPRGHTNQIWETNSMEERKRIKQFWLDLPEDKRRSLVNIEKRHVLEKMKEQQKHSCSCTVCGRKRTAIEEELEVLLQDPRIWADPTNPTNASHSQIPGRPARSRITELADDEDDDFDDPDEDEEYSDEEEDDDYEYSDEEAPMNGMEDRSVTQQRRNFFRFGSSLTVKDGILTVAEDLLKNDGQKFIDMMEMLAEKRIQREELSRYGPAPGHHHHHAPHGLPPHNHSHAGALPPEEEEEYDEEEDDYNSEDDEDYDEEDDEMDTMTEDQRMEEGRKMFQIFAARMFEQRVVQAYKEKVAEERQRALIEEEFGGKDNEGNSEAKRAKAAEKKKRQREKAKESKAAKDAAKEEDRQKKEAATREAEEKKKEEQRQKQEEARKRKDAEREALAEKKRKKDAEAQKRLDAERERQQEQERKLREQKTEEKRKRDEAERQKREEKEAREKEASEQKAHQEQQRREAASKADQPKSKDHPTTADSQPQNILKRPSVPAAIALPPTLKSRASYAGSPQTKVATPALPKAPTPSKPHEAPSRHTSTPHTPERTPHSKQSSSPKSNTSQPLHPPNVPPMRTASQQYAFSQQPAMSPVRPIQPPPGMQQPGFGPGGMHPMGGFAGQGQMRPGYYGGPHIQQPSMYPQQRSYMPNAPPGMMPPGMLHHQHHPPGPSFNAFGQPPSMSAPHHNQQPAPQPIGQPRDQTHSRQASAHLESPQAESATSTAAPAPISRPAPIAPIAPIKRPASVKPGQTSSADVDDLSKHLGSSALIGDDDEPLDNVPQNRRPSAAPGQPTSTSIGGFGSPMDQLTSPFSRAPTHDSWGRTPFGPPGIGGHAGWTPQSAGWGGFQQNSFQSRQASKRSNDVRMYTVNACHFLTSANRADEAGFLDYMDIVKHTHESSRRLGLDPSPIRPDEIDSVLNTFGDSQNGGGTFHVRQDKGRQYVKWVDERASGPAHPHPPPGPPGLRTSGLGLLGEIGSPRTESSVPSLGGLGDLHR